MKLGVGLMCAAVAMWLGGCAETSVNSVTPGSLAGLRSGSVYVPVFDAKPTLASAATGEFVAELSARGHVLVVRGDSIAHDTNPDMTSGSMLQNVDAGMAAGRQTGANLLIVGEIDTHRGANGGVTAVAVLQLITLADGGTVTRLRQEYSAANEREAAVGVAKQAAQVLAAGF